MTYFVDLAHAAGTEAAKHFVVSNQFANSKTHRDTAESGTLLDRAGEEGAAHVSPQYHRKAIQCCCSRNSHIKTFSANVALLVVFHCAVSFNTVPERSTT